jgi:hypothetical protein
MAVPLTLHSTIHILSGKFGVSTRAGPYTDRDVGHAIPQLGFGVALATDAYASSLEAFKAGYMYVFTTIYSSFSYHYSQAHRYCPVLP